MMKDNIRKILCVTLFFFLYPFCGNDASGGNIRFSKHNLSVSGSGSITASSEDRICIFCHMPRRQGMAASFLWNRQATSVSYTPYYSSTIHATVGQPTGASRICLSCHDGTIALGALVSEPREIPFKGGIRFMPEQRPSKLGTDLSDDHPVSFVYDSRLSTENPEIRDPSLLPSEIRLDRNQQMQCTACHDPHDDTYDNFLVMFNRYSALCTACHEKKSWQGSSHAISDARLNRQGTLWSNTDYQTVAENGCENCHKSHSAGSHERLLHYVFEEDNCLSCHNGNVTSPNIETELTMPFKHPVQDFTGVHDAAEDFISTSVPKHIECVDCHNPHQANGDVSYGQSWISGANKGVTGVSASGVQVAEAKYLYEICFKCHADNNVLSAFSITRQIDQLNTRLEFDPSNPSFHPVEEKGKNSEVPSLLSPYTTNSVINCTDCHGSGDSGGPKGPHGSLYEHILNRNYETMDYTVESYNNYALCYKCHSRTSIINNESFKAHGKHIETENAPCSACHDPHGVSITQGNSMNNSHLINFDLTIALPDDQGRLYFNDLGRFSGECFLKCHGVQHDPKIYGP